MIDSLQQKKGREKGLKWICCWKRVIWPFYRDRCFKTMMMMIMMNMPS